MSPSSLTGSKSPQQRILDYARSSFGLSPDAAAAARGKKTFGCIGEQRCLEAPTTPVAELFILIREYAWALRYWVLDGEADDPPHRQGLEAEDESASSSSSSSSRPLGLEWV